MVVEKRSTQETVTRADLDNPWKYILKDYFQNLMEFCLPDIASDLDWQKGLEFLDKELKKITRDAKIGSRLADKLIKVWSKAGEEKWILCHVEIQGSYEKNFPERMLIYRYRIKDRYNMPILSIAILIDDNPRWRPEHYTEICYTTYLKIQYVVIKILDYRNRRQVLEQMDNPFAMILLAQLAVLETANNPRARLQAKSLLTRKLYEKGMSKKDIMRLFTFIDWLIHLPEEYVIEFNQEINKMEEEKKMRFITTPERVGMWRGIEIGKQQGMELGIKKGIKQGIKQGIERGRQQTEEVLIQQLKYKFHEVPPQFLAIIQQAETHQLLTLAKRILDAVQIEEVFT